MDIFYRVYRYSVAVVVLLLMMMAMMKTAFAASDEDAAGQVIVVSGSFQAVSGFKAPRTLERGAYFYSGDLLRTGTDTTAQVRFADGAVLSLNPNSQIKVDDYSYSKNPDKDKSTIKLVKGGFRALTGLISKENPESYKIETPVAVIGVRGTNFSVALKPVKDEKNKANNKEENKNEEQDNKDQKVQLFAGVWDGNITITNDSNKSHPLILGKGNDYNFVMVDSQDSVPVGLLNPPAELLHQCGTRHEINTNI